MRFTAAMLGQALFEFDRDWKMAHFLTLKSCVLAINCLTVLVLAIVEPQVMRIASTAALVEKYDLISKVFLVLVAPLATFAGCIPFSRHLSRRGHWLCIPTALLPLSICIGIQYFI